jgi:hypothetical protein
LTQHHAALGRSPALHVGLLCTPAGFGECAKALVCGSHRCVAFLPAEVMLAANPDLAGEARVWVFHLPITERGLSSGLARRRACGDGDPTGMPRLSDRVAELHLHEPDPASACLLEHPRTVASFTGPRWAKPVWCSEATK